MQGHKEAVREREREKLEYIFCFQTMFLAVGRGILYSTGTDLSLKSWQLGALTEMARVEVRERERERERETINVYSSLPSLSPSDCS